MSDARSNALLEREMIVNQYLRGLYDGKPIAKEYSKGLKEIKRLFASVLPYYAKKMWMLSLLRKKQDFR